MLGTLSRTKDGIEYVRSNHLCSSFTHAMARILEKFKVFTAYYHLMELRSREDLMIRIIETLDYSMWDLSFA